jgi:putative oxidoreductase
MSRKLERFEPYALSIMRIVIGFMFACHGGQKIFGWFGGLGPGGATAKVGSLLWAAGVIESVGGLLILLGLFTSCVAFVLCGEMASAYFIQHAPQGLWPTRNGGELAVLYCFIYLHLVTRGGGAWSLDHLIRKRGRK